MLAQARFLLESCRSEVIKDDKSVACTHGLFTWPLFLQKDPGESHRGGVQRGKSAEGNCLTAWRGQLIIDQEKPENVSISGDPGWVSYEIICIFIG